MTGVALWGGEDGDGRKPLRFRRALVGPVHEVLGTTRSSSTFDLSADATRFAAVWDDVDGISAAVFVAGEPLPEPAVIVDSPGTALYPTVVSDGSGFRVAYIDGPVGAQKVYFVRVRDACAADEG